MEKLFIVTRKDLEPGDLLAQTAHAVAEFAKEHRALFERWHDVSNTIIVKVADDELELKKLLHRAIDRDIRFSRFHEPDMDDALTALAFEPAGSSLVRNFPRAFE